MTVFVRNDRGMISTKSVTDAYKNLCRSEKRRIKNKEFSAWWATSAAEKILRAAISVTGLPDDDLVIVGEKGDSRGSYLHIVVALAFVAWVDDALVIGLYTRLLRQHSDIPRSQDQSSSMPSHLETLQQAISGAFPGDSVCVEDVLGVLGFCTSPKAVLKKLPPHFKALITHDTPGGRGLVTPESAARILNWHKHWLYKPGHSKIACVVLDAVAKHCDANIQHFHYDAEAKVDHGEEFKIPGTRYRVDGYDHKTRTVYEFHGNKWHGYPPGHDKHDVESRLYKATMTRMHKIQSLGYTVCYIWEHEWDPSNIPGCVHTLRAEHAGGSGGSGGSAQYPLVEMDAQAAQDFEDMCALDYVPERDYDNYDAPSPKRARLR